MSFQVCVFPGLRVFVYSASGESVFILEKFNNLISRTLAAIAGVALVSLVALVFTNVVMRLFDASMGGVPEMVGWLTAVVISFSLAYSQQTKAHIDLDILVSFFPGWLQRVLGAMAALLSLLFFLMVAWELFKYGQNMMDRGAVSQTLRFAYYPFIYAVALGMAAFCSVLLSDFLRNLIGVFKK